MSIKLDIGCSTHKLPGYFGVDLELGKDVDIVADLHAMPFDSNSIDEVHSRHTLEHVDDPHQCLRELYRIIKPSGVIKIIVPHYSNHAYWADMTHKRPFSVRSFEYFDLEHSRAAGFPIYIPEINLKTVSARLVYWPPRIYSLKSPLKRFILGIMNSVFSGLANASPFLCERFWCNLVGGFYEVDFTLKADKKEDK